MKKATLIILFISLLTFSAMANAKMEFQKTTVDFGEADSGKIIDLEFKFKNSGNVPLIIKNLSTSCGCTATKLEKKEYQPGEEGSIPVKFNTRGYTGKVTKSITITTNDEANRYTRLKITGKLILKDFATIKLNPERIDFKKVAKGERIAKKINLKNEGTIDLRLIEVSHSPEIMVEFDRKLVKPGDDFEIKLTFTPMQEGKFSTFLKIRTNAHKQRLAILRMNAEVEND
ncbi:MAG: DUF1573 domain-containing protein [bacterium]|nr:DUF1573 domain-containing protein [bacterium]